MPDPPDASADPAGKRAFWIAFGVSLVFPVYIALALYLDWSSGEPYEIVLLGAAGALLSDFAFLVTGCILLFIPAHRAKGSGLILGMMAGATVGFGVCMVPDLLGM